MDRNSEFELIMKYKTQKPILIFDEEFCLEIHLRPAYTISGSLTEEFNFHQKAFLRLDFLVPVDFEKILKTGKLLQSFLAWECNLQLQ